MKVFSVLFDLRRHMMENRCRSCYGEHPEEIGPARERAFTSGEPTLVNVVVGQDIGTGMKRSTCV
ncbi:MAG: hypothetical protein QF515_17540 [Pseudomonadales bacterium]|nr:hypothetical protein [Pseudomonadales bacterium]MDP6828896.1 hypothetical protein [Pseudomonadales bacterium]